MMMTAMVVETSVQYGHLTWLIAREDYIKFNPYAYKDWTNIMT